MAIDDVVAYIADAHGGRAIPLRRGCVLTIGRDATAALVVQDKYASRQHVALISSKDPEGSTWIVDTSMTGTILRSQDLTQVRIQHGGVLIKDDFSFLIGTDAARKSEASSSKIFRFTEGSTCHLNFWMWKYNSWLNFQTAGKEATIRSCWIERFVPWKLLPPHIKDVMEHLPTRINFNIHTEPAKPIGVQTEEGQWCKPHSQVEQAFSVFDLISKKLPLPLHTIGKLNSPTTKDQKLVVSLNKSRQKLPKLMKKSGKRSEVAKPKIISPEDYDFDF